MNTLITLCIFVILYQIHGVHSEKYQVCVVDGRGGFKRAAKNCPILDKAESKVECVIGVDRLDCLRRISKGKVDFSLFTPEDLVTATNSEVEVLLTNEMRFTKDKYEYEVVAVVNDGSGIKSRHDLRGKHFCHPGYGYETDWTNILANYLEATVVPQTCSPGLTLTENRIFSSSNFFKAACKAGPWVNDPTLDTELKNKYPNLCELCDVPSRCSRNDKYWGRRGPLYCLTDGYGDVSWARLDDVKIHFGLSPGSAMISPEGFSYLCKDGSTLPINSTTNPCVWVVKPWPVIAAKRKRAQEVQEFITSINQSNPSDWESALLNLIETYHQEIVPLQPVEPIETYLANAQGFLSANSFTGCHPPRTIRICSNTNIANAKCGWLREAAAVYGVEPDLDCIKAHNISQCMEAIESNIADVVIVEPDDVHIGKSSYNLQTLFYETVTNSDKYLTVAVVKENSSYKTLEDLKGAKACFPKYDGIAWNSVIYSLNKKNLLSSCPYEKALSEYFSESCVPNLPKNSPDNLKSLCHDDNFDGDYGAIRCLMHGDVAFVSINKFEEYFKDPREYIGRISRKDFRILGENESKPNHLSWATIGQAMVSKNKTKMWMHDTLDVFQQLDNLFGKNFKSVTTPFTLFGIFDGKTDILFHDNTLRLKKTPNYKYNDNLTEHYDSILDKLSLCVSSDGKKVVSNLHLSLILLFLILFK